MSENIYWVNLKNIQVENFFLKLVQIDTSIKDRHVSIPKSTKDIMFKYIYYKL